MSNQVQTILACLQWHKLTNEYAIPETILQKVHVAQSVACVAKNQNKFYSLIYNDFISLIFLTKINFFSSGNLLNKTAAAFV